MMRRLIVEDGVYSVLLSSWEAVDALHSSSDQ